MPSVKICTPNVSMSLPISAPPSTALPPLVLIAAAALAENPDADDVPDAVRARWMIVPRLSPSTNVIVTTRPVQSSGIAFGVSTSGTLPWMASPMSVSICASRLKSNSSGTCARYSFKIEV